MRIRTGFTAGLLLLAVAPLLAESPRRAMSRVFSPEPSQSRGQLIWFRLGETQGEIARLLGPPHMAAESGSDHVSWQYRIGGADSHDHSHILVFRRSTRTLVSVTRRYEPERLLDDLFPNASTSIHYCTGEGNPAFSVRLRKLAGSRILMAMGVSRSGQPSGQLVLATREELRVLYPWLDRQLGPRW